jgi:type I restriction enzyme S subunit
MKSRSYRVFIESVALGINISNLRSPDLKTMPIWIAPLPEQQRIVTKINSLSPKSDRVREKLDHIPRLVAKYKRAILATAFRGELTQGWRSTQSSPSQPAKRLENLRLERVSIGAKESKREMIVREDSGRIPIKTEILPTSWATTTLEQVTSAERLIQYGILMPGPHIEGGVPYVKVMNIRDGRVHLDRIRCTTPEIPYQYRRASIATGDILLTIRGTVRLTLKMLSQALFSMLIVSPSRPPIPTLL